MYGDFTVRNPFHTIDFHHHTLLKSSGRSTWKDAIAADFAERAALMDAYGIDQGVLLPGNNFFGGGHISDRDYNEFVATYRDRHRERFPYAFGTANPLLGAQALEDLRHAWTALRVDGFVWHHRMLGIHINHHSMEPLWSLARQLGAPCAVHLYAESRSEIPWRLEEVAIRYPEVTFIALDAFSGADQAAWMQFIAPRHPNIIFETGAMVSVGHSLNEFLRKIDFAPRLIFGSDYYPGAIYHHPGALVEILGLNAPDAVKKEILSQTLQRLLNR